MDRRAPADTKLLIAAHYRLELWRPPLEFAERVRSRWPAMRVVHLTDPQALPAELADSDIFVSFLLRPDQLRLAARLRWLHSTAAGVAQFMFSELRDSGIVVTNATGVHAAPIAEHVVGMLVALARDFPAQMRYQLQRRWAQREIAAGPRSPRELSGCVALLVGFGAIGRAVAERIRPLGMRVWAVTHSGRADTALADRVFGSGDLDAALAGADFVIVAVPETPQTRRLLGAPQFSRMKRTAFLLNVARGAVLDEPALADALAHGTIAGAALDVAAEEPLPPESPLWSLDNVILTPHTSGISDRMWEREADLLLDNVERWFGGQPLRNRVDLSRGY